jgi:hypothetical protein
VPKWWNWQTRHLEGVVGKLMGVRVPPSAPNILSVINNPNQSYFYELALGIGIAIVIRNRKGFSDPDADLFCS